MLAQSESGVSQTGRSAAVFVLHDFPDDAAVGGHGFITGGLAVFGGQFIVLVEAEMPAENVFELAPALRRFGYTIQLFEPLLFAFILHCAHADCL